jgi:hypothetical protein
MYADAQTSEACTEDDKTLQITGLILIRVGDILLNMKFCVKKEIRVLQ